MYAFLNREGYTSVLRWNLRSAYNTTYVYIRRTRALRSLGSPCFFPEFVLVPIKQCLSCVHTARGDNRVKSWSV